MTVTVTTAALGVLVLIASAVFFFFGRRAGAARELQRQESLLATGEHGARRLMADAEQEAERLRKSALLAGKEELIRSREEWEAEARRDREDKRVQEREAGVDRRNDQLEQRDRDLGRRASELGRKEKQVAERQAELDRLVGEERHRLEQLAGMSVQDAKAEL